MLNNPSKKPEWKKLEGHYERLRNTHLRDFFARDSKRFENFHLELDGLLLDYSRQRVTAKTMILLCDLAKTTGVESWRNKMFAGKNINHTEGRAVLHTALRTPKPDKQVADTLARMKKFSDAVRKGKITDVVNIGIGGSDLGPHMVCEALRSISDGPRAHFVSNVDGAHLERTLQDLKPTTTLFIVSSKTFTTQETMTNALAAKKWAKNAKNFAAVTSNIEAAKKFGIAENNIFPMWDWVGGRYSLWSAIGLPICIAAGFKNFRQLLDGAHAMDEHFKTAKLDKNIPVILALLGIWQRNFGGARSLAILPYAQSLSLLPAWLQQLDMESNGKSTDRDGKPVTYQTSPVIFGEPGTNGQHAFYQMLHQGTNIIPCDFIAVKEPMSGLKGHHEKLLANAIGQAQALMQGQENALPWKRFEGNRPSSIILLDKLDPYHLGMLLALYEHKIFVQGVIWNLNSFDQWGVELGKTLANNILSHLEGQDKSPLDSSSRGLIKRLRG
jgi:glucose-6-phosphate isomerase